MPDYVFDKLLSHRQGPCATPLKNRRQIHLSFVEVSNQRVELNLCVFVIHGRPRLRLGVNHIPTDGGLPLSSRSFRLTHLYRSSPQQYACSIQLSQVYYCPYKTLDLKYLCFSTLTKNRGRGVIM